MSSASVWGLAKNSVDTSKRRRRTSKKTTHMPRLRETGTGCLVTKWNLKVY